MVVVAIGLEETLLRKQILFSNDNRAEYLTKMLVVHTPCQKLFHTLNVDYFLSLQYEECEN